MSTTPDDLTPREYAAIEALREVSERWPDTLMLFSWSGTLVVFRKEDFRSGKSLHDIPQWDVHGITNDGGDPE
jgi:hypothetical protein